MNALIQPPLPDMEMAAFPIPPSARPVHKARTVVPADEIQHRMREEFTWLRPAFIVGAPHDDRRNIAQCIHHLFHFGALEMITRRNRTAHRLCRRSSSARQVLDNQDSHFVAQRIILERLHLDVLAQRVVAAVLQHLYVVCHRLFARRGKKSVRPPSLVERPHQEARLVVQEKLQDSVPVLALFHFPHSEIAGKGIPSAFHPERIQIWRIGAPQLEVRRHFYDRRLVAVDFGRSYAPAVIEDLDLDIFVPVGAGDVEIKTHLALVDIGHASVRFDMRFRHNLHPHGLPNARNASIKASMRFEALLAARIHEIFRRVPNADGELVRARLYVIRNVKRERILPALVRDIRDFIMSDKHHRTEIDPAKVEQNAFAGFRAAI